MNQAARRDSLKESLSREYAIKYCAPVKVDYKIERIMMSKKNKTFSVRQIIAACSAFVVFTSSLTLFPSATVIAQQASGAQVVNPRSAAIAAATEEVLRETSEIRQLRVLRPVRSGAQSRADIERMVVRNLDERTTPEELRTSELALRKLGLVPANFQLRPFIISLLTEQVAGYYEPRAGMFHLADWIDLDAQSPVMAHELAHALQDQHFNLRRFENWQDGDSDREQAIHALIEGDAMLVMAQYVMRNPARAMAFMRAMGREAGSREQFERAPRALRETLTFPYEQGFTFATQVFRRGGWQQVSQAYTDLPQSTEQILHPEKYFARETPVRVEMPDIARMLGRGWRRSDYDINGELSFYLILDEFLRARDVSRRAAAGWGGDRYSVYEGARPGEVLIAQMTAWDTEQDAVEFYDAYARRTRQRYANPQENSLSSSMNTIVWRTTEGNVWLERRGVKVLILEGVPENANARSLTLTLWR